MKAEVDFSLAPDSGLGFSMEVLQEPVEMWGINFAGSVLVRHKTGEERVIYLPGTRTYDPAGITGKPPPPTVCERERELWFTQLHCR